MKARLMNARRLMYHLEIKSGAGYRHPSPLATPPHTHTPCAGDVLMQLRRQKPSGGAEDCRCYLKTKSSRRGEGSAGRGGGAAN